MELLMDFFTALWELTGAMAPYILMGLFFAGILHEWLPNDFIQKHLGSGSFVSVLKSTLLGIPLPVCSCGVIPLAASLKKEGASRGSVLSFLISTPITGVDSILATFGMFGWIFTIYRVATSIAIAFVAGLLSNLTEPKEFEKRERREWFWAMERHNGSISSLSPVECGCENGRNIGEKKPFSFAGALRYGFVTLMKDIARPLLFGLLIGAAITVAIPENLGEWLGGHRWAGYLLVLAIAVPMYVCATASLPIAASLVLGGVSLGAAFVFLSAGPATNTVTIGVVKKMLGSRSLLIYLATIVGGSLLFGVGLDLFFGALQIDPHSVVHLQEQEGWPTTLSSVILWGLVLRFVLPPLFRGGRGAEEVEGSGSG